MLTRPAFPLFVAATLTLLSACQEAVAGADDLLQDQKIDPPLLAQLDTPGLLPVALLLKSQFLLGPKGLEDFASRNEGRPRSALRTEVVHTLREAASAEQSALLEALGFPADARRLWIANAMFVSLTAMQIRTAASQNLVRYIYLMPNAPPSYDHPGTVTTVLTPGPRSPFSAEGKRIPWNVERIGASRVWEDFGVTGEGVVDEIANNGIDDDDNGLIDDYYGFNLNKGVAEVQLNAAIGQGAGHGTFTSGIVLGDGTGGIVSGLAPRAQPMVAIVGGDTYAMGRALEYAIEEGADVATMGFSLPGLGNVRGLWRLMADHAVAAGLVLVSGAGNFQQSAPTGVQQRIPEAIPSVISVGGVDSAFVLVPFSSLGPVSWSSVMFYGDHASLIKPDVVAFPGPEYPLIRAEGAGYLDPNTRRGNSFSGPHATGVAALILSANPELPVWEVKEIMEETARDLSPQGRDNRTGAGRIDAFAAVREALTRR